MFSGIGGFREGRGFWPWGHKRTDVSLGRPKSLHCKEPAMRFCRRQNDAVLRRQASTRAGDFVCVGHCELDEKADESYRALFDCEGRRFCHGTQAEHTARIGMAKCKPPRGLQDRCPVCAANAARSASRAWYCSDAREADSNTMPEFDLLCGGFPCQAFSIAGSRRGFGDPRGTLFFELARLAEARHPPYLLFENVPGLLSHDGGRTFAAILDTLDGLGFFVGSIATGENDQSDKREAFLCLCPRTRTIRRGTGVPQSRRRVYLVGTLDARCRGKYFLSPKQQERLLYKSKAAHRENASTLQKEQAAP